MISFKDARVTFKDCVNALADVVQEGPTKFLLLKSEFMPRRTPKPYHNVELEPTIRKSQLPHPTVDTQQLKQEPVVRHDHIAVIRPPSYDDRSNIHSRHIPDSISSRSSVSSIPSATLALPVVPAPRNLQHNTMAIPHNGSMMTGINWSPPLAVAGQQPPQPPPRRRTSSSSTVSTGSHLSKTDSNDTKENSSRQPGDMADKVIKWVP